MTQLLSGICAYIGMFVILFISMTLCAIGRRALDKRSLAITWVMKAEKVLVLTLTWLAMPMIIMHAIWYTFQACAQHRQRR